MSRDPVGDEPLSLDRRTYLASICVASYSISAGCLDDTDERQEPEEAGSSEPTPSPTDESTSEKPSNEATEEPSAESDEPTDEATTESDESTSDSTGEARKPTLQEVNLKTVDVSNGTELELTIRAESNVPVDWLRGRFEGPNETIWGQGTERRFREVEENIWEYVWTDHVSENAPSGEYSYTNIRVRNEGMLESDSWSEDLSTTIRNDVEAEKPTLQEVTLETSEVSDGTELELTIRAESNVPVDWLRGRFEGPNETIWGQGTERGFREVEENLWEYVWTDHVSENAPSGEYRYTNIKVRNEGMLESDPWSGNLSTTIENDVEAEKPALREVTVSTSEVSDGTELELTVRAESNVPVNWLRGRFEGPNETIWGQGIERTFREIEDDLWEYIWTDKVSENAPSGEYYYTNIRVRNEGMLESDPWPGDLSTTIDNSKA